MYDACSVIIALIQLTVFKLWLFDKKLSFHINNLLIIGSFIRSFIVTKQTEALW